MNHFKCVLSVLYLLAFAYSAKAQSGTYQKRDKNSALCNIAISKTGNRLKVACFAWWGTTSGTSGTFSGTGMLKGDVCTIKSVDDAGCTLNLALKSNKLESTFSDCMASNLPEDFSGAYNLLTTALPGVYRVKEERSYFYKSASTKSRLQAYLLEGDKAQITLENVNSGEWVYVNYRNKAGRVTSGYMRLADLKLIEPNF